MKRFISIFIAVVMICVLGTGRIAWASQPKVMVTDYRIWEDEITAGDDFHLSVTVRNTSSYKVASLKISIQSEAGDIVPYEGAGTAYEEEIAGGEERTFEFRLKASEGIAEKSYKMTVTCDYDDRWGNACTSTDTIYLPVKLEQRISITDIYTEDEAVLGDSVEIIGSVNNTGAGTLYNVTVSLDCEYLNDVETYIGNIESGKSGSIDMLTKAVGTTPTTGSIVDFTVTYEDREGNKKTETGKCNINISSPVYDNVEKIKDDTKPDYSKTIAISAACVIAAALIVVMIVRKRRRKKEILEEFS